MFVLPERCDDSMLHKLDNQEDVSGFADIKLTIAEKFQSLYSGCNTKSCMSLLFSSLLFFHS